MNAYKGIALTAVLTISLGLTGCAGQEQTAEPNQPTTSQKQSSPTQDENKADENGANTESTVENKAENKKVGEKVKTRTQDGVTYTYTSDDSARWLWMDDEPSAEVPARLVENASAETKDLFSGFDMEEGVATAINNFHTVQTIETFSQERDTSKDAAEIYALSDILTQGVISDLVAETKRDKGLSTIVVAYGNGTINDEEDNLYQVTSDAPKLFFDNLKLSHSKIQDNGQRDLVVEGNMEFLWTVQGDRGASLKGDFVTNVTPTADGGWVTTRIYIILHEFSLQPL